MKIKQIIAGFLLLFLFNGTGYAQSLGPTNMLDWVVPLTPPITSTSSCREEDVKVDQDGNVYSAGVHSDAFDCDPGTGVYTIADYAGSVGDKDSHLIKYDKHGNLIWGIGIGGTNSMVEVEAIALDSDANAYMVGEFQGTIDFDPSIFSSVSLSVHSAYSQAIFIAKYDSSGVLVWAKKLDQYGLNSYSSFLVNDITVDRNDNLHVVGSFNDTLNPVPQPVTSGAPPSVLLVDKGEMDGFAIVLDSDGNYIRSRQIGGIRQDRITSVSVDSDLNVYYTGVFQGQIDVSSDTIPDILHGSTFPGSEFLRHTFVIRDDSGGNLRWAKMFEGDTYGKGLSITCDQSDDIIVVGEFRGSTDFDPNVGIQSFTTDTTSTFIAKMDFNGNLIWAEHITQRLFVKSIVIPMEVTTDVNDNIYLCGYFDRIIDFNPDPSTREGVSSNGTYDGYILKLNSNGDFNMVRCIGGDYHDIMRGIDVDECENIYAAGSFMGTVNFAPNATAPVIINYPDMGGFVFKLKKQARGCGNLNSPFGNSRAGTSNLETTIFPNPTSNIFNIQTEMEGPLNVTVIDDLGRTVLTQQSTESKNGFDMSDFKEGVYTVVMTNGMETEIKKLVLSK